MSWEAEKPTKIITVIPLPRMESGPEDYGPFQMIQGRTVLFYAYENASLLGDVIVGTPGREAAHYCNQKGFRWRPIKDVDRTGIQRCQEIFLQVRKNARAKIDAIVYWPWFRVDLESKRTRQFVKEAKEGNANYAIDAQGLDVMGVFPARSMNRYETCNLVRSIYEENLPPALTKEAREEIGKVYVLEDGSF